MLRNYLGVAGGGGGSAIDSPAALRAFLVSRASHVSQTALYGYMKTRAGTRFPELFESPAMLAAINIAKWQLWLACLSDLAVYAGVLLCQPRNATTQQIRELLVDLVQQSILETNAPEDAGDAYDAAADKVIKRIHNIDFNAYGDDETPFTESPAALVYWSPVADELKKYDTEIIRNSIRYRWQEVRRELRKRLRAEEVLSADGG